MRRRHPVEVNYLWLPVGVLSRFSQSRVRFVHSQLGVAGFPPESDAIITTKVSHRAFLHAKSPSCTFVFIWPAVELVWARVLHQIFLSHLLIWPRNCLRVACLVVVLARQDSDGWALKLKWFLSYWSVLFKSLDFDFRLLLRIRQIHVKICKFQLWWMSFIICRRLWFGPLYDSILGGYVSVISRILWLKFLFILASLRDVVVIFLSIRHKCSYVKAHETLNISLSNNVREGFGLKFFHVLDVHDFVNHCADSRISKD